MRQIKSEIKQQTKASLFRKIIDFFIWGGLFLGFIALQHRYHRTLLVKVPINLITGEIGSKHNVYKPTPAFHTSPEKTTIITWNHFDSLVRMNQLNLSNRSVFNKSVDIFSIPLNNIDSVALVALPGIGTFTAKKIVQYRERLGGFISKMQLLEIPYLDSNLLCHPQLNWEVDTSSIKKIRLIDLDIGRWYKHPYIGKERAKLLQQYVKVHRHISKEQFFNMKSLNALEKERISWYLTF